MKSLNRLKPQESEYEAMTLPPDFTWDPIRSADSIEELAFRIAAGVGGTTMPAWKDTIEDEEIWGGFLLYQASDGDEKSAGEESFDAEIEGVKVTTADARRDNWVERWVQSKLFWSLTLTFLSFIRLYAPFIGSCRRSCHGIIRFPLLN